MVRRWDRNKSVGNVPRHSTMGVNRPRGRCIWKKLPRDAQRLAILFGGRTKAKHNPWEAVSPVAIREAGPGLGLHVPMKPLAKSVALGVIGCGTVDLHSQDLGDRSPKLRRKLRTSVRGEGHHFRPSGGPVHHGEEVGVTTGGGKWAHQVHIHMIKTPLRHFEGCQRGLGMTCTLARHTGSSPSLDIPPQAWTDELGPHQLGRSLHPRVGKTVYSVKHLTSPASRDHGARLSSGDVAEKCRVGSVKHHILHEQRCGSRPIGLHLRVRGLILSHSCVVKAQVDGTNDRPGETVGHKVFLAGHMLNVGGIFRYGRELTLLATRPWL
ncbi:hypothetical protein F2P79_012430 [Pimephales promelas]|nr:hypothetical protein F2P79_012430 [Pimephales promelas]